MKASKLDSQDRAIVSAVGIFLALSLIAIVLIRAGFLESPQMEERDRLLPIATNALSPPSGIPIVIGAYIENIYVFSADNETFDADGWVWLRWPDKAQEILQAKNVPPAKWLNFVNQINDWDFSLEPVREEPMRLKDGGYYQNFKFSGHFYANGLDFRRFPFQTVRLPLVFELAEIMPAPPAAALHLVADQRASGVGAYIDVIGYRTMAFNIISGTRRYATNFGLEESDAQTFETRQVAFVVSYQRSVNAALLTLVLPLVVVMSLVLFAPMLSASLWDIRLGIPPMALLTLIFLQQSYKEKLPELPYATYMDLIYNACYLVNLVLFGLFLWGSNRLHQTSDEERPAMIMRLDMIDRRFQIGLTIALMALTFGNWMILTAAHP